MGVNKIIYNGNTLIDLTGVTVDASKVLTGYKAIDKSGNIINGTLIQQTVNVANTTATGEATTSISFTGLKGAPTFFTVSCWATPVTSSATRIILSVWSNGKNIHGISNYQSSQSAWGTNKRSSTAYSYTYANGTLTVTSSDASSFGVFRNSTVYRLDYVY